MKLRYLFATALSLGLGLSTNAFAQRTNALTGPVFAGYFEYTFANSAPNLLLKDTPMAYNLANISFCTTIADGTVVLPLADRLYRTDQDFVNDIKAFQQQGGLVQCSLGGAGSPVRLTTPQQVGNFVASLKALYAKYPFDGIDIDLEGASLRLDAGDTDFRNPTTPQVKNFIQGVRMFLDAEKAINPKFTLTMAPETFFVGQAIQGYGSGRTPPAGGYLPFIEAFRNDLTYIFEQNYNSGDQLALDRVAYDISTVEFLVGIQELLLQGFPIGMTPQMFQPLKPSQVAIGLLSSPNDSDTGFATPDVVTKALNYLTRGEKAASGTYKLRNPAGYPTFGGLMTFSIQDDVGRSGGSFSRALGPVLSALRSGTPSTVVADANQN